MVLDQLETGSTEGARQTQVQSFDVLHCGTFVVWFQCRVQSLTKTSAEAVLQLTFCCPQQHMSGHQRCNARQMSGSSGLGA